MTKVQMDYSLSDCDFSDIVDTAGYAIYYWASKAKFDGAIYAITEEDNQEVYFLDRKKVEDAIVKIFNKEIDCCDSIWNSCKYAVMEEEYGEIDSLAADAIMQVACFNELVYS